MTAPHFAFQEARQLPRGRTGHAGRVFGFVARSARGLLATTALIDLVLGCRGINELRRLATA